MSSKVFNVGIIGYGQAAKTLHIPLILEVPELKLHGIVQRHPTPSNDATKDHPGATSFQSSQDMLQDASIDAVVITTSPDSHFDLTKQALEHGKHVVVEKPFTPTAREAEELITLAHQRRKLLTVYQNRRWDTDFLTVCALLEQKSLGRIVEFESHFDRHRPVVNLGQNWKTQPIAGGAAIYDLGTHLIDQIVVAFGMPKRITGFCGSQRENNSTGFEDSFTVLMHFDGLLATVKAAVVSPEKRQLRYWIRGTQGSYKKFDLDCQEIHLREGRKPSDDGFGVESDDRAGILTLMNDSADSSDAGLIERAYPNIKPLTYATFYRQFASALAGGSKVPVDPAGCARVIHLIELARQSSREGRTIALDDDRT